MLPCYQCLQRSCLTEKFIIDQGKEMLGEIIDSCYEKAKQLRESNGYKRAFVTTPLPGTIDVPFHSHYLCEGFELL